MDKEITLQVSGIERGKEKPSLEIIIKISNVLQVTPDYLLLGITHSNNVPQSIYEGLRLCSSADLELIIGIMQLLIAEAENSGVPITILISIKSGWFLPTTFLSFCCFCTKFVRKMSFYVKSP